MMLGAFKKYMKISRTDGYNGKEQMYVWISIVSAAAYHTLTAIMRIMSNVHIADVFTYVTATSN